MRRRAAVAGTFYPGDPTRLAQVVQALVVGSGEGIPAVAVMVPHAGYVYSGGVAGRVFAAVRLPRRFVILCPNHTGLGPPLSINLAGEWETPLGAVPVDDELAAALRRRVPALEDDDRAHLREHALEVQLPFLQNLLEEFRFVPICVGTQDRQVLLELGQGIAAAVSDCPDPVLVVVSSDMTHYEPADAARRNDMRAVAFLEAVDPEGLHRTVHGEGISMCGIAPAVAGLAAARTLGSRRGRLLAYAHSGEVTGDHGAVVGYAGLIWDAGPA